MNNTPKQSRRNGLRVPQGIANPAIGTIMSILGVPRWARWIAVDSDGEVNVFSAKPTYDPDNTENRWRRESISNNWQMVADCDDQNLHGTLWKVR